MSDPLYVLCVCTHNRTRSVLMGSLLQRHLDERGIDAVVGTAGLKPGGEPATRRTVQMLGEIGIDVGGHRSQGLNEKVVSTADLILTAEREHVVLISGMWPNAFRHTFTLPEAVALVGAGGARAGVCIDDWLVRLGTGRPTGLDYYDAPGIGELQDPTGQSPAVWSRVFTEIDTMTRSIAAALA